MGYASSVFLEKFAAAPRPAGGIRWNKPFDPNPYHSSEGFGEMTAVLRTEEAYDNCF